MENQDKELLERVREQFNSLPYPSNSIEASHEQDIPFLYIHSLVTAFYVRNKQVINPADKVILDAGCGSGYKALGLAQANPGAQIVGVDISERSVELAEKRLRYHGIDNAEFVALALEDLPKLGRQFDYINCDETFYLVKDQVAALKAMKAVLKPDGILRINLHSLHGRTVVFRAQEVFKEMGLFAENPEEFALGVVRDMMNALKDDVLLKKISWKENSEAIYDDCSIMVNYLLVGDRGFTIPELFSFLRAADLEFIEMVRWRDWNFNALFKEPHNLPVSLELIFSEASLEDKLHLFELLHPINRLLDIWCGHPQSQPPVPPVTEWMREDWQGVIVHLHPLLKRESFKQALFESIQKMQPFDIYSHFPLGQPESFIDSTIAACVFPALLEQPQSLSGLVQRWQVLHPVHPATLQPMGTEEARELLQQVLITLESGGYVLLQQGGD
ncbi:class I SAM-dependent methyltransferase [Spirulina subsalsa]|uniref:class I SAM-dependent methyltransferase n=1 Tax=Spirulina subsalsa TaxID=54311 RepID=UPI0002D474FA|nr:class I SAM-dependent methyltransferase [Spirulina subsalsa]